MILHNPTVQNHPDSDPMDAVHYRLIRGSFCMIRWLKLNPSCDRTVSIIFDFDKELNYAIRWSKINSNLDRMVMVESDFDKD